MHLHFVFLREFLHLWLGKGNRKRPFIIFNKAGIWLIFIELTVVTFGWQFDLQFRINGTAVIAMLGLSMIILSALIYLPRNFLIAFCCVIIFGHNLLDNISISNNFYGRVYTSRKSFLILMGLNFTLIILSFHGSLSWLSAIVLEHSMTNPLTVINEKGFSAQLDYRQ